MNSCVFPSTTVMPTLGVGSFRRMVEEASQQDLESKIGIKNIRGFKKAKEKGDKNIQFIHVIPGSQ